MIHFKCHSYMHPLIAFFMIVIFTNGFSLLHNFLGKACLGFHMLYSETWLVVFYRPPRLRSSSFTIDAFLSWKSWCSKDCSQCLQKVDLTLKELELAERGMRATQQDFEVVRWFQKVSYVIAKGFILTKFGCDCRQGSN